MEKNLNKWLKLTWVRETLFYILLFVIFTLGDYESTYSSWKNFIHDAGFYTVLYNQKMRGILRGATPIFLSLKIENSIPQKKKNIASTGIGLENVQQRLLRLYPYNHALKITPTKAQC